MRLAEELPAAEEHGLSLHLRQLMVQVPAAVAEDLIKNRDSQLASALKLVTVLELIDLVYPALDTADTKSAADALLQRLASPNFNERQGVAGTGPALQELAPAYEEPTSAPADTPLVPAEAPAAADPMSNETTIPAVATVPVNTPTVVAVAVETAPVSAPAPTQLVE